MTSTRTLSEASEENFKKLKEKLRELLQLDKGDLDFGLYRIMAHKSQEIDKFLESELLPQVSQALGEITDTNITQLQEELKQAESDAKKHGVDLKDSDLVKEITSKIATAKSNQDVEAEIYDHLYRFFSRYYEDGDFITLQRSYRAGKEVYSIPYNGEEVKLHYATANQYYVKTTENFSSYIFHIDDQNRRVKFEIEMADCEKDNTLPTNGNERFFVYSNTEIKENELTIRFEHRVLTKEEKEKVRNKAKAKCQIILNDDAENQVKSQVDNEWQKQLFSLAATDSNKERTILSKHLTAYTSKNSFDYFIHKDLGGFLRAQLDKYLKDEVLYINDLSLTDDHSTLANNLAQLKAIKLVGNKIIDFLDQLENFQKSLWLKKKFILETQYLVTVNMVPDSLYSEIAKNQSQLSEWKSLYKIEYTKSLNKEFFTKNPYLTIDTKHFNQNFIEELLASISKSAPLDEQMTGLLIHSDNFQALNLIQGKYRGKIKAVYIDPPYNTDSSAILYKNGYKDSSWLSLMEDRFELVHSLLQDNAIICSAIDDEEVSVLRQIMANRFESQLGIVAVRSNPSGRKTKGRFAPAHEYALFYGNTATSVPGSLPKTDKDKSSYPQTDELGNYQWTNLIRSGTGDTREDRPKQFYPIFVEEGKIRVPKIRWDENLREWILQEKPNKNTKVIYPVKKQNGETEGRWHRGHTRIMQEPDEYEARCAPSGEISIYFKKRMDEKSLPKTWWDDSKYSSANGTRELTNIFGASNIFDFSKSVNLVQDCIACSLSNQLDAHIIDYFAGSGTTGQAVLNLNRKDGGKRKYILVEMGHHFDDVLLPRIKKVTYAEKYKNGTPQDKKGVTQFVKYLRLESYEDTLDSLKVEPDGNFETTDFEEDYQLRYALTESTAKSMSLVGTDFYNPQDYSLSIVRDGVRREENVDLIETFSFLLGLSLETIRMIEGVKVVTGKTTEGVNCLILWRKMKEMKAKDLNTWFKKHRDSFGSAFDRIYVNGDHLLNNLKEPKDNWEAFSIEPSFKELMFLGSSYAS